MGHQIIKQPDGLLAVLSSYTDTIVLWEATRQEVLDWFAERDAERARQEEIRAREAAIRLVDLILTDKPREAYHQFARTWEQALQTDREHGGECWSDQSDKAKGAAARGEPCTAEVWSWDHFTPNQVDPYWIRCTLAGVHEEHEDENTGLRWSAKP